MSTFAGAPHGSRWLAVADLLGDDGAPVALTSPDGSNWSVIDGSEGLGLSVEPDRGPFAPYRLAPLGDDVVLVAKNLIARTTDGREWTIVVEGTFDTADGQAHGHSADQSIVGVMGLVDEGSGVFGDPWGSSSLYLVDTAGVVSLVDLRDSHRVVSVLGGADALVINVFDEQAASYLIFDHDAAAEELRERTQALAQPVQVDAILGANAIIHHGQLPPGISSDGMITWADVTDWPAEGVPVEQLSVYGGIADSEPHWRDSSGIELTRDGVTWITMPLPAERTDFRPVAYGDAGVVILIEMARGDATLFGFVPWPET